MQLEYRKAQFLKMIHNALPLIEQTESSHVFFKHVDLSYANCNTSFLKFSRLSDKKNLIDCIDINLPWADECEFYRRVDQATLAGQSEMYIHDVRVASGEKITVLENKKVIYGVNKQPLGLIAKIAESVSVLSNQIVTLRKQDAEMSLGMHELPAFYTLSSYKKYDLSERESQCLFYLLRGMTVKLIARFLKLSPRTVEKYVTSLKTKLNCMSKTDLIRRAVEDGVINIIPPTINLKLFQEAVKRS